MNRSILSKPSTLGLIALLIVTAILRFAALPSRYDMRDVDEPDYLQGGLLMLEGLPVSFHYAPAGPESWFSWVYGGAVSAKYFFHPTAEEARVPAQVRVYVAVNHALFDIYRDESTMRMTYVVLASAFSLVGVAAAYRLGLHWGGMPAALMCGGLTAFTPLFTEFAGMARPYTVAWSFGAIAMYFAAVNPSRKNAILAGIFSGLAVSSRIEMLLIWPLIALMLGVAGRTVRQFIADGWRFAAAAVFSALIVTPWLITNLLGNLRAIATIRFGPKLGPETLTDTIRDFALAQGMAPAALILFAGAALLLMRWRAPNGLWRVALLAYVAFLFKSLLHATGYGMRHHGAELVGIGLAASFAGAEIFRRWPRVAWGIVALVVLPPFVQAMRQTIYDHRRHAPDDAVAWVNAHVPPGTIVYVAPSLHELLPTTESADAMWDTVMARQGAVDKFTQGLTRLQLGDFEMPRALSEQHMVVERSRVRRYFILGSRAQYAGPRFDLRRYANSAVESFSVKNPVPSFQKTGGILIWREQTPPVGDVGEPVASWPNSIGGGTFIYCSPDLRPRLAAR